MKNYSIEAFDQIKEDHQFSKDYDKRKKQIIGYHPKRARKVRMTVALAAVLILSVAAISAATIHTDFLNHAFGEKREDTPIRETTQVIDKGYEEKVVVVTELPEREFEPVDQEQAEEILEEKIADELVQYTVRDHTFEITSIVRDDRFLILDYTIECPKGIRVLEWDPEISDDAHGAMLSDQTNFWYGVEGGISKIWVDYETATDTKIHCTEYVVLREKDAPLRISFTSFDGDPELALTEGIMNDQITDQDLVVDYLEPETAEAVEQQRFTSEEGGELIVSPIGIQVHASEGLGLDEVDAEDYGGEQGIHMAITYQDGSEYIIYDSSELKDNTSILFSREGWWYAAFNRLVAVESIDSITVNGIDYKAE